MNGDAMTSPHDPLLTPSQVRKRFNMNRSFLYYQIEKGRIAAFKRRGRLLVPLSSVVAFQATQPLFVSPDGKRFYDSPGSDPYGGVRASRSVALKLTPHERAAVQRLATASGLSLSDPCRVAIGDAVAEYDEGAATSLRRVGRRPPAKGRRVRE